MSLTFHRAHTVAPGDAITSAQLTHLARAYNDRLRSGIADGAERVLYYTRNAFLAMVNPSGDVPWPQAHALTQRHTVEPEHAEWPDGEPGFDNGAAIGSNWPAYVFGSEDLDMVDEGRRLTDPTAGGMPVEPAGGTPRDYWELGKRQRGAYDASTGALASPSFTAARAYAAIRWRWWSPQGSSFGGYFPTPELTGVACEDPIAGDDYPAPPNWEIFFTNLSTGATKTYDGTCQDGPDISVPGMYDTHIYAIGYAPWAYYVLLNDGTLEELSTALWQEGPYEGEPKLTRAWGNHFERFGHRFAGDLRGVEANEKAMRERSKDKYKKAMNCGKLVRQQYLLAPARGTQGGDTIDAVYQTVSVATNGVTGPFHAEDGFVFAAVFAEAQSPASLEVLDADGDTLATCSVTAAGKAVALHPAPTSISFRSTGAASVELAELMEYKPGPWDILMLSRIGAARM